MALSEGKKNSGSGMNETITIRDLRVREFHIKQQRRFPIHGRKIKFPENTFVIILSFEINCDRDFLERTLLLC